MTDENGNPDGFLCFTAESLMMCASGEDARALCEKLGISFD